MATSSPLRFSRLAVPWIIGFFLLLPLQDEHFLSAPAAYDRAHQLFTRGDLEECQRESELGYFRYRTRMPDWASKFRLLQADAMVWRGLYDDALRILADFKPAPGNREAEVRTLAIESVALIRQQQPLLAEQKLEKAETDCRDARFDSCGEVLRARGIFAGDKGQFDQARQSYLDMLAFAQSHRDRFLAANAALNLGWIALQTDRFDEALDWSRSAYQACEELGAEDLAEKALGNQGTAYFALGDTERALQLFLDAEKSAEKRGDLRSQLGWITTEGDAFRIAGDLVQASASYRRAFSIATQIKSKGDIVNSLESLAHASIDAGKLDDADGYLRQLDPLLRASSNRLDALDVMFAQAGIAAARRRDEQAEAMFKAVEQDPGSQTSMRLGAEHELARLYQSQGNDSQADRMYLTSLSTFEAARGQLKNEESKLPFLANATGIYDDYLEFLVQHGRNDEALSIADQSRARTLAQGLGVTSSLGISRLSRTQASSVAKRMNATFLFYWLGERQSYLWAITPAGARLILLPAQKEILPMIARYRKALLGLGDPLENLNPDGIALYETLIAPAAQLIKPGSKVVVLNDGALSQLNFETLIVPGSKPHYWIEDATLISAPSLSLLASAKPSEGTGHKLLLVGDAASPGPDYPELPMAASEMKQIEQTFPDQEKTVFAREQATAKSYFGSSPQQFAFIHFVAHGVASRTDPLDSSIILSRSSAEEDSFKLHAREIIQHPIHARLVTVTACYGSGTRSYAGEGVVGLAWAFLRAGAHNVIGALWEVSDASTPRLMGDLYRGLQKGAPPSEALRQAKLSLLHSQSEYRKPFYWAPLQIYTGL